VGIDNDAMEVAPEGRKNVRFLRPSGATFAADPIPTAALPLAVGYILSPLRG